MGKKDGRAAGIVYIFASSTSISLWYAKLSRKCLRSLGDSALSFSSGFIKARLVFICTVAPLNVSEHTVVKHLHIEGLLDHI